MPRAAEPKGDCAYCGTVIARNAAGRHLAACEQRRAAIDAADASGRAETLLHLRVQAEHQPAFWMDLEMRGAATLHTLDGYLRAIWLECCGHLSRFSVGGWRGDDIGMRRKAQDVFRPGTVLTHIYDFGTSSHTLIKLMGTRQGAPTTDRPIALLARNRLPEEPCVECQAPATRLCMACVVEDDVWSTLCDTHARRHRHGGYGRPTKRVNSPRLGLCGYDGPADPPY